MADISTRQVGFKNLSYALSALPIVPYLKLEGFGPDGVQWEKAQPASVRLGADAKAAVNQRAVLYTCTINLLANSNSRNTLDMLVQATTPKYGVELVGYSIVMTVVNQTTGQKTIYTGGVIEEVDAGDNANLDDGQGDKQYRITFTDRVVSPF